MKKSEETTCRALMLDVMVCMMDADGVIDDREVKLIGDVYEEIVGFRLSERNRDKLIRSVTIGRTELLELLKTRIGLLGDEHRARIFRAGRLVLEADAREDSREWRLLLDIGRALGMSDVEIAKAASSRHPGNDSWA